MDSQNVYFPMIHYEIDAGNQYDFGEILRISKSGGGPPQLIIKRPFDQSYGISAMAVDNATVYWGMKHTGIIFSASKTDGGTITPVATSANHGVQSLAVDDAFVYFLDGLSRVQRVPKTGGSSTDITPAGAQLVNSFTVDATMIGVADRLQGMILGGDKQGGNAFPLAPPEQFPSAIGWDPGHAYWISRPGNQSQIAVVRRVDRYVW